MIFTSQSALSDPSREAAWDAWYAEHLRTMVTVPGIRSAQRFKTASAGHARSLAMYTVASPAVFADPYYQNVRGMGEWLPLIDPRYYRRTLFGGLEVAPDVPHDAAFVVVDREQPIDVPGLELIWITAVGLDRSTACRGIAFVAPVAADAASGHGVAVYRSVSARITGHEGCHLVI